MSQLEPWAERNPQPKCIVRNLGIRFYEEDPRLGVEPDLCVLAPPPENLMEIESLCLWQPGHVPPSLCFEVANHPFDDYTEIFDRYAVLGTQELIVFDPLLQGLTVSGDPVLLQLWRREGDAFVNVQHGSDPVYSQVLEAWVIAEGRALRIADRRPGDDGRWLTEAETERRRADALEREVAELRALLAKK